MTSQPLYRDIDQDLDHKAKKVSDKVSETINIIANEPSLAFFRIQEHVRKTLPQLVDTKHEVEEVQSLVQGACFDTEYATNAIKNMQSSAIHFQNIQDLLKNAMHMKQQISHKEARKKQGRNSPGRNSPASSSSSSERRSKAEGRPDPDRKHHQLDPNPKVTQIKRVQVEKDTVSLEDSAENREVERYMARPTSPFQK